LGGALPETLKLLAEAREKSPAVLVGYSGGKDSLAVLDLCVRTFKRVECFHMYVIPGMRCVENMLDFARKRWGVKIHQYPHWVLGKWFKIGAMCNSHYALESLPEWKLTDVYNLACADTGITLIAHGAKRADSLWRRRNLSVQNYDNVIFPVIGWNKFDITGYLTSHGIPLPPSSGRSATGIDLTTPSVLWLHDNYPDDFRMLCEVFPYAECIVYRRKFYGIQ
jgi:3'-phosphoadenosine 5'-phosphosulfate sulfotransferase (PAPS reductase)/FAD synthetase